MSLLVGYTELDILNESVEDCDPDTVPEELGVALGVPVPEMLLEAVSLKEDDPDTVLVSVAVLDPDLDWDCE